MATRLAAGERPSAVARADRGADLRLVDDAIDLLSAQHREAEALLLEVDQLRGDSRWAAFLRLARSLLLHAQLEEDVFYPEIRVARTEDFVSASLDEHGDVRRLITILSGTRPESREFQSALVELKAAVDAHIAEEEGELFPEVERLLSREQVSELGGALQRRLGELSAPDALPAFDQPPPMV